MRFDHPDQTAPRHGGNNWVRIDLPAPLLGLTAYRTAREIGAFIRFTGEDGVLTFAQIEHDLADLRTETALDLTAKVESREPFKAILSVSQAFLPQDMPSDQDQIAWIGAAANRLVTALRPRCSQWMPP